MNAPVFIRSRAVTREVFGSDVLNRAFHAAGMPYLCYGCDLHREHEVTFCPQCDEVTSSYVMERGQ